MSDCVKACIVGGGMRAAEHAEVVRSFPNIKLVGVFDPSPKPASHWLRQVRVPFYNDLSYMIRHTRPDFAIVTGPHDVHLDLVREVAGKGVHVMKEKPLARNLAEARAMLDAARGVKLFVTMQRRYSNILARVASEIVHLGRLTKYRLEYTLNTTEPATGWRGSKERAGGGCIIDMGYHMIDEALWFFGQPQAVRADFTVENGQEVENEARILVSYGSGLEGEIFISRGSAPKREGITIEGTEGRMVADRVRMTRNDGDGRQVSEVCDREDWGMILGRQFRSFLGCLNGFASDSFDAATHLAHVAFVEACYSSRGQNRSVALCL